MFAGGELSDEDKTAFMDEIQSLYLDSKETCKEIYTKEIFRCQIDGVIIGQPIGYSFIVRSNITRFCLIHTRGDIFGEFIYLQQSRKTCKKFKTRDPFEILEEMNVIVGGNRPLRKIKRILFHELPDHLCYGKQFSL